MLDTQVHSADGNRRQDDVTLTITANRDDGLPGNRECSALTVREIEDDLEPDNHGVIRLSLAAGAGRPTLGWSISSYESTPP